MEMYLETILRLCKRGIPIREVDIATNMNITKASVCKAVQWLNQQGLVRYENHRISLTQAGKEVIEQVYERHCIPTKFLITLVVSYTVA